MIYRDDIEYNNMRLKKNLYNIVLNNICILIYYLQNLQLCKIISHYKVRPRLTNISIILRIFVENIFKICS